MRRTTNSQKNLLSYRAHCVIILSIMKYKLIVADFDDTILNSNLEYSQRFVDAVRRYVDKGGEFHIATGRMTSAIIDVARDIGLKGDLLTFQGAIVIDVESGEVVDRYGFSVEDAHRIAVEIEKTGEYYHVYDGDNFITAEGNFFSKIYAKFSKCGAVEIHRPVSDYILETALTPPKMMVMTDPDNVANLIEKFSALFSDIAIVNTSKEWMVEIVPKDIDKGKAVSKLANKLGIKREETICIGDSLNDASMLKWAGLSACVANGSDGAKAVADIIAPSNDEDGVAYVIEKYGLEE